MKKFQKSVLATLTSMALLLMPTQAIFAKEVINNTSVVNEIQEINKDFSLLGAHSEKINNQTEDIYCNGNVTIKVNADDENASFDISYIKGKEHTKIGTVKGSKSKSVKLYGYHKFVVVSSTSSGTFSVEY
ncbi:phosphosulfolactate phosphohydrolase-like enzyme [Paenibacillus turicensis]|uniref:Phosphosulfolactate phosphohydrolase-like enzyme n=1 Tax=Paenibacillus turicensis TaxID=160487 RepID=A0ABS4FLT6_9BACL|nr:hypothetical protein [Paenibacillus turicensis]MBP1903531.1 phosphosulfolactate phosphohydrolase-like enzyme [Paenibacillus turicensis]